MRGRGIESVPIRQSSEFTIDASNAVFVATPDVLITGQPIYYYDLYHGYCYYFFIFISLPLVVKIQLVKKIKSSVKNKVGMAIGLDGLRRRNRVRLQN